LQTVGSSRAHFPFLHFAGNAQSGGFVASHAAPSASSDWHFPLVVDVAPTHWLSWQKERSTVGSSVTPQSWFAVATDIGVHVPSATVALGGLQKRPVNESQGRSFAAFLQAAPEANPLPHLPLMHESDGSHTVLASQVPPSATLFMHFFAPLHTRPRTHLAVVQSAPSAARAAHFPQLVVVST
jgi:hypothetical protein